jgi:hypothetical protein
MKRYKKPQYYFYFDICRYDAYLTNYEQTMFDSQKWKTVLFEIWGSHSGEYGD